MTMPKVHAPDLSQLFSVAGKNVLITGGTGGIGTMFATTFLAAGARVWITGRKADALAAAREELSALGPVETLEGDLATVEGVKAIIEGFQAQADRLHVLINNAGQTWGAPLERFPERAWDAVHHVNVKAPFMLTQGLLPQLLATATDADPARIINIGSIYGEATEVQLAYSYTASKAAIHQLTRACARIGAAPYSRECHCPRAVPHQDDGFRDEARNDEGHHVAERTAESLRNGGRYRRTGFVPLLACGVLHDRQHHSARWRYPDGALSALESSRR